MRIFEQAALCRFEDGRDRQKKWPGAHLFFGEGPADEHDKIDETKEGDGKTLQDSKKSRTDPVRREILFQKVTI